jgi:flavin-dependent dehydrogenase
MSANGPDILVVGAGSAGAAAAALLAEQGFTVWITDWRRVEEAGARWVNAVPGWCFDESGFGRPEGAECVRPAGAHSAIVADADGNTTINVAADPAIHVDMRRLVARLQERARQAGVTFLHERAVDVEMNGARLEAVILTSGKEERRVEPRLTVDASGQAGAIRHRSPILRDACPEPTPKDLCSAAQYQYRVADPTEATAFLAEHGAQPGDGVSFMGVAGGYSTLMVSVRPDLEEVSVLAGTIPADGVPPGATVVDRFVRTRRWIGERLFGGQGEIPLGPPYVRLTAPGLALIGNAANQVYALHGSGVGLGLMAARLLADAMVDAPDPGNPARIHRYAMAFQRRFGGRLAAANQFRRLAQTLNRADISALLAAGLISTKMLSAGMLQAPFSFDMAPKRMLKGAARQVRLAAKLSPVVARMMMLQRAYDRYPRTPDARALERFAEQVHLLRRK